MATKYTVIDPFENTPVHHTETQGDLPVGTTGYVVLNNPETVKEIKEKNPHFVVAELRDQRVPGRTVFLMPELPYKKEKDGKRNSK